MTVGKKSPSLFIGSSIYNTRHRLREECKRDPEQLWFKRDCHSAFMNFPNDNHRAIPPPPEFLHIFELLSKKFSAVCGDLLSQHHTQLFCLSLKQSYLKGCYFLQQGMPSYWTFFIFNFYFLKVAKPENNRKKSKQKLS